MKLLLTRLLSATSALALAASFAGGLAPSFAIAQTATPPATETAPDATVMAVQVALNAQGVAVTADGILNDATRAAIRTYQSQHHLPVTGEPDAATLAKLGVADLNGATAGAPAAAAPAMGDQAMMGMMTPEMMTMMQRMHAMMGAGMMGVFTRADDHDLRAFDTDNDASVSPEELRSGMQAALLAYDADGNGSLSIAEFETLHSAHIREAMVDRFQAFDADGDGQVTEAEITAPADRMRMMGKN